MHRKHTKRILNTLVILVVLYMFFKNVSPEVEAYYRQKSGALSGVIEVLAEPKIKRRISIPSDIKNMKLDKSSIQVKFISRNGDKKDILAKIALGTDLEPYFVNGFLIGFMPFFTDNVWATMQTVSMRLKYQLDREQFHPYNDIWQTSKQAYSRLRGDCEDHAILLSDWLISLGYDARVVLGEYKNEGHALNFLT